MSEELNPLSKQEEESLPYGEWFYWLQTLVISIICIILIFTFVFRVTRVMGQSMDPTLTDGELLVVWSLGYHPKQGDIVIANDTTASSVELLHGDAIVKRVIATEHQTVDIDYNNNTVYVDGEPLDEDYTLEEMRWPTWSPSMMETHFEVPEGEVFLMGDNRNGSTDSRHVLLGSVSEKHLLGKAVFVLFPFNRFGLV